MCTRELESPPPKQGQNGIVSNEVFACVRVQIFLLKRNRTQRIHLTSSNSALNENIFESFEIFTSERKRLRIPPHSIRAIVLPRNIRFITSSRNQRRQKRDAIYRIDSLARNNALLLSIWPIIRSHGAQQKKTLTPSSRAEGTGFGHYLSNRFLLMTTKGESDEKLSPRSSDDDYSQIEILYGFPQVR
ncbi:hypothetical protein CEXT_459581 [Caerostris extrusa]|uniref:Uncharacterized protein n=1 Tax=Caerostris extrusa TaxID=172846 RepID=A0AAV4QR17_CAEEX|nr:hypothetical protein CEXT_459581 [Caerostris extrusa]